MASSIDELNQYFVSFRCNFILGALLNLSREKF